MVAVIGLVLLVLLGVGCCMLAIEADAARLTDDEVLYRLWRGE